MRILAELCTFHVLFATFLHLLLVFINNLTLCLFFQVSCIWHFNTCFCCHLLESGEDKITITLLWKHFDYDWDQIHTRSYILQHLWHWLHTNGTQSDKINTRVILITTPAFILGIKFKIPGNSKIQHSLSHQPLQLYGWATDLCCLPNKISKWVSIHLYILIELSRTARGIPRIHELWIRIEWCAWCFETLWQIRPLRN